MRRKNLFYMGAALAVAGLAFGSCTDKKNAQDSNAVEESVELTETTSDGTDEMTTQIKATQDVDGSVEIDNTLPTEVVTAEAPAKDGKAAADGYVTTPTGLKYKVVKKGNGAHPTATSTVTVKYTGKLQNGTVFDSTDKNGGKPISFPLNRVIPGWTEGLQLMQPGAVYQFVIPSNLAYGPQGVPGAIPPNATLVFDVELISID